LHSGNALLWLNFSFVENGEQGFEQGLIFSEGPEAEKPGEMREMQAARGESG
jgi:hypothetical protein